MKANELMIGDWVVGNSEPFQIGEIEPDFIYWDEIKPIPLTAETLEKNGFFCEQDRWWWKDFYITLASTKALTLVCNRTIQIKYVHQLQQALRLCGIKKEIEL